MIKKLKNTHYQFLIPYFHPFGKTIQKNIPFSRNPLYVKRKFIFEKNIYNGLKIRMHFFISFLFLMIF